MATARSYDDNAAPTIASEVVASGYSEGWCGTLEQRDAVRARLRPFRIVYVCDMTGRFELSRSTP